VIAPRHPDRAGRIAGLLEAAGLSYVRRSAETTFRDLPAPVLLADSMGEMGLWYALANGVFLGGGSRSDVGGHNPLEPARLGKRVVSGPHVFNFTETFDALLRLGAVQFATTSAEIAKSWEEDIAERAPGVSGLDDFFAQAEAPMSDSLAAIVQLLAQVKTHA